MVHQNQHNKHKKEFWKKKPEAKYLGNNLMISFCVVFDQNPRWQQITVIYICTNTTMKWDKFSFQKVTFFPAYDFCLKIFCRPIWYGNSWLIKWYYLWKSKIKIIPKMTCWKLLNMWHLSVWMNGLNMN